MTQSLVLLSDQIHHKGWVTVNQGEKTSAIQTNQRQRRECFGITTVEMISSYQIPVEEQFPRAITGMVARTSIEFHQPLLHNVDRKNGLPTPKNGGSSRQGEAIALTMFTDQFKR